VLPQPATTKAADRPKTVPIRRPGLSRLSRFTALLPIDGSQMNVDPTALSPPWLGAVRGETGE